MVLCLCGALPLSDVQALRYLENCWQRNQIRDTLPSRRAADVPLLVAEGDEREDVWFQPEIFEFCVHVNR